MKKQMNWVGRVWVLTVSIVGLPNQVNAVEIEPEVPKSVCSRADRTRIKGALGWLKTEHRALVDEIRRIDNDAWAGNSEKRFRSLFKDGDLTFRCVRDEKVCGTSTAIGKTEEEPQIQPEMPPADAKPEPSFGRIALPALPHGYPPALCIDMLKTEEQLISAIAHYLGHHVLLHTGHAKCEAQCRSPRLSRLMELAVYTRIYGIPYSIEQCLLLCENIKNDSQESSESGSISPIDIKPLSPPATELPSQKELPTKTP